MVGIRRGAPRVLGCRVTPRAAPCRAVPRRAAPSYLLHDDEEALIHAVREGAPATDGSSFPRGHYCQEDKITQAWRHATDALVGSRSPSDCWLVRSLSRVQRKFQRTTSRGAQSSAESCTGHAVPVAVLVRGVRCITLGIYTFELDKNSRVHRTYCELVLSPSHFHLFPRDNQQP